MVAAASFVPGTRFGRLEVVSRNGSIRSKAAWLCRCDCGGNVTVTTDRLIGGSTKSCGCFQRKRASEAKTKHGGSAGHSRTKEYSAWIQIRRRTIGDAKGKAPAYVGVTICEEWANSFPSFLAHIGPAPTPHHTVDRINPNRGYEPGNVRWATSKEQNRNRRRHVYVLHEGRRMIFSEACELTGLNYYVAHAAMRRGKSPFKVVA